MPFFQVIVPPLDHPLTYEVQEALASECKIGQRVLVPLKKKLVTGYLWEEMPPPEAGPETKAVSEILDPSPLFSEAMRPFFLWIAQYYLHPLGQVLKAALPAGLSVSSYQSIEITPLGIEALQGDLLQEKEKEILQLISSKGRSLSRFLPEEKKILKHLEARGLIQQTTRLKKETARPKKERWVYPGGRFQKENFSKKDLPLFELLTQNPCLALKDLRVHFPLSAQRLATLGRKGLIEIRDQVCLRDPLGEILALENGPFILTGEQEQAVARLREGLSPALIKPCSFTALPDRERRKSI